MNNQPVYNIIKAQSNLSVNVIRIWRGEKNTKNETQFQIVIHYDQIRKVILPH